MTSDYTKNLIAIQDKIDESYLDFVKKDFDLKLSHYQKIKADILKRDTILLEQMDESALTVFMSNAITNFEAIQDLFPQTAKKSFDSSFVKFLKAEFLDNYKMKVTMHLNENKYVNNSILEKTIHLFEDEPEAAKIEWKDDQGLCPILDFFESDEDDMKIFDIIYKFYVNLVLYSVLEQQ
jgi:hypothetical protein